MARYKTIATDPKLLAVDIGRQLLPGTPGDDVARVFAAVVGSIVDANDSKFMDVSLESISFLDNAVD